MTENKYPPLPEPDSYLFQHEDTGLTQYVDSQQVEWGFEKNNPALVKCSRAFTADQMRAYADAAIAADRAAPGMLDRWRGIDSAPKGKAVLVHYKNSFGHGRTMKACYYMQDSLESDTTESGWADEGWYEQSESYEYLMPLEGAPTHWMGLPAAPGAAPIALLAWANLSDEETQEPWNAGYAAARAWVKMQLSAPLQPAAQPELTDNEIDTISDAVACDPRRPETDYWRLFARAVIAAHESKKGASL